MFLLLESKQRKSMLDTKKLISCVAKPNPIEKVCSLFLAEFKAFFFITICTILNKLLVPNVSVNNRPALFSL